MDFVNEEHVVRLHRGQDGGDVAGALNRRSARRAQVDAQFSSDDPRERGLAQAGWSVEQQMVKRLVALFGGVDGDADRLVDTGLADKVVQSGRAQGAVMAVDLGLGRVNHSSGGRAFLAGILRRRHSARRRNALRLATASG